ncbi:MAG: hypothetical protein MJE77_21245 [Proteobacteria bacterium]|nr:hypothetical protein [Pseudomonadota bacterium]
MRLRYRIAGTTGQPVAALVIGYRLAAFAERRHQLVQGVAARWEKATLAVTGELTVREQLGGDSDNQVEIRTGAAVTHGMVINLIRVGLESFALIPITGPRISDPASSPNDEDVSVYVGPTLRLFAESLWLTASAATGRLTDPGSPLLVRVVLGAQFSR